ncbi:MAG: ComEC/Rec2 family competence protein, partial [Planctomycetales bacterium]|nr:ComEC/Rec2 family competence protein [Planctomycetales bacterium]
LCWRWFPKNDLAWSLSEHSQPAMIEGVALSGPRLLPAPPPNPLATRESEERCSVDLRVTAVRQEDEWQSCSGRTRLIVDAASLDIQAGDRLRIAGFARRPSRSHNPGEFDEAKFHRGQRRLFLLRATSADAVQVVQRGSPWSPWRWLQAVRAGGNSMLWRYLGRTQAGLAAAVLLGLREQVDRDRTESFMQAGTIHLLAISGLHVGILAMGLMFAARFFLRHRRIAWMAAAGLVLAYALLTDARPPVMRAAALVGVICVGRCLGRPTLGFNTLAAAGLLVLALNPDSLFHTGAQLSFLAVATLSACGPLLLPRPTDDPIERLIESVRPWWSRSLRAIAGWSFRLWLTSVLVWLVALPLVSQRFHLVSLVAIIANPIVWIPITLALFSGFGVLLSGPVAPPLAETFGWICDRSFAALEAIVMLASHIPYSHVWTAGPALSWVVITYLLLGAWYVLSQYRPRGSILCLLLIAWLAVGLTTSPPAMRQWRLATHDEMRLTFLSVGHGCCVVIELPDGQVWLYDCGRLGQPDTGERIVSESLWEMGIQHVDRAIISHADADHYNILPGLMQRVPVAEVCVSPWMFTKRSEALSTFERAVEQQGALFQEIDAGDILWESTSNAMSIDVLHPVAETSHSTDNANSIVLRIRRGGQTMLLPGDLEADGMRRVLAQPSTHAQLVMAPHHGSIRSSPDSFGSWARPEWVVVSGGEPTDPRLRQAFAQHGASLFNTDELGAIRCTYRTRRDGSRVSLLEHWSGTRWQTLARAQRPAYL